MHILETLGLGTRALRAKIQYLDSCFRFMLSIFFDWYICIGLTDMEGLDELQGHKTLEGAEDSQPRGPRLVPAT